MLLIEQEIKEYEVEYKKLLKKLSNIATKNMVDLYLKYKHFIDFDKELVGKSNKYIQGFFGAIVDNPAFHLLAVNCFISRINEKVDKKYGSIDEVNDAILRQYNKYTQVSDNIKQITNILLEDMRERYSDVVMSKDDFLDDINYVYGDVLAKILYINEYFKLNNIK